MQTEQTQEALNKFRSHLNVLPSGARRRSIRGLRNVWVIRAMAPAQVEANQPVVYRKRVRETSPTPSIAERNVKQHCDLDLEILECPICTEHLSSPVYQCQSGHPLCSACHMKISNCPSCSEPIGNSRCLLAEKIIDSLQVSCVHAAHGCKQMLKYSMREEHIKNLCEFRPCPCPVPGCIHEGYKQALPQHLREEHKVSIYPLNLNTISGRSEMSFRLPTRRQPRHLMLKDENEKVRLLLHREPIEFLGDMFFCTSFGDAMKYDLKVWLEHNEESYAQIVNVSAKDIRLREDWKREALIFTNIHSESFMFFHVLLYHDN